MKQATIRKKFESYLRRRSLKLTSQRGAIFERAFATHEHFSAETLFGWLRSESDRRVSRATVYRTLSLLEEGGFIESLDTGSGELVYEHVLGHEHHDHLICLGCKRIVEFQEDRIEELQEDVARRKGFRLLSHSLRLMGLCAACARLRDATDAAEDKRRRASSPT